MLLDMIYHEPARLERLFFVTFYARPLYTIASNLLVVVHEFPCLALFACHRSASQ